MESVKNIMIGLAFIWVMSLVITYGLADPFVAGGHSEDASPLAKQTFFWLLFTGIIVFGVFLCIYTDSETKRFNNKEYRTGDRVRYVDHINKPKNGIVKQYDKSNNLLQVVFECDNWDNFKEYPAQLTKIEFIIPGWLE